MSIWSQANKTLLSIMLIKFATGFTGDWGVISLYVLSYFHYHGAPIEIKASTNSLLMIMLVVPVVIAFLFSVKIANYVGYVRLIRICGVLYFVIPLISFISFNFVVFVICNMIAPVTIFTLSFVPIFNCMYSHFGDRKNLATGMVIGSFSIGAIVWNFVATFMINPDNAVPQVPTNDHNFSLFPRQIADQLPWTVHLVYLISGVMFVFGSLFVTTNQNYAETPKIIEGAYKNQNPSDKKPERLSKKYQIISYYDDGQATIVPQSVDNPVDVKQYIKQPIVYLLFLLNIFGSLYQIYVQLNTKIIYMPILGDDHLISMGLMIIILSSAVFSIGWGFLADKKGPFYAIMFFLFLDLAVKIYASLIKTKQGFIISMVLIGATDKTMFVLFAPIIIDVFGLKVATQLLPLKGVSGIIAAVLTAIWGFIFMKFAPDKALIGLCAFCLVNIVLGTYLAQIIKKYHHKSKEEVESQ